MRSRYLPRFVPLVLVVVLLAACSGSSDEAADTTVAATTTAPTTTTAAPTTTTSLSTAEATELIDGWIAAWNSGDPAAVAIVFADEFSFKGLGPYEPERTDMESVASYMEALAPLEPLVERTGDLTVDESGRISFQMHITSKEVERIAAMEAEAHESRITRWVTLDWEKP